MRTEATELAAVGVVAPVVEEAAAAVVDAVAGLERVASASGCQGEWLAVVGACQGIVNRVAAVQDAAIAQVARVEQVWCEDGTLGEVVHRPGRVALDAADVVAPLLGASHRRAVSRVADAVRLTGHDPVPLDVTGAPERTGLEGLHAAMRAGRLDAYRASVVAEELVEAPAQVARAVIAALEPHLDSEAGPGLRRRTRRLLARISPDLLARRAVRARAETGLRRWVSEPGVDTWHGTFPSEDSAAAWAAVDALARKYVTEKVCATIEAARGKALTDLVTGHADVTVTVHLTVPAATGGSEDDTTDGAGDPGNQDGAGPTGAQPEETSKPTAEEASAEPGNASGEGPPPNNPTPAVDPPADSGRKTGRAAAARATRVPGTGGDLVAVTGARPGEPVLVPAAWLAAHTGNLATVVSCHPGTGARLDPDQQHATGAYRPGRVLVALAKARDGRCRFPGCSISARFCDLDHVRPWPAGPTDASNLLCLCRRHHRIKQAPGWRVVLHPDGRAEWTDPTGRLTVTEPVDALDTLVLHPDPTAQPPLPTRRVGEPEPGQLPSAFEDTLDHQLQELEVRAAAPREAPRRDRDRLPRKNRRRPDRRALLDPLDRRDRHHLLDRCRVVDGWLLDGPHRPSHRSQRPTTFEKPPF